MSIGIVKFFNQEKGFGFIVPDEGGKDIFCHYRSIEGDGSQIRSLTAGQQVSYEVGEGLKGPEVKNIRVVR